jgi:sugar lactone lactonase YvrE
LKDGRVTHYQVPGNIHVLAAAPDGSLLVGAGCGVWRFRDSLVESLLDISCDRSGLVEKLRPLDIVFGDDGLIWVGGALSLASYDGETWQEYYVPSVQIAIDPDGSIWTHGWDGRAGSQYCITHISASGMLTYSWSADIPASAWILDELLSASDR